MAFWIGYNPCKMFHFQTLRFFKNYILIMLLQLSPFAPLHPATLLPQASPTPLSMAHVCTCSLAILFPMLSLFPHDYSITMYSHFFSFLNFIYLFLEKEEGREKEREENINVWLPLAHHPALPGPGLQPRHVPWLGIKPRTLWFTGRRSTHWATPARTLFVLLNPFTFFPHPDHPPPIW